MSTLQGITSALCGVLVLPGGIVACELRVQAYYGVVRSVTNRAISTKTCVEVRFPLAPTPSTSTV